MQRRSPIFFVIFYLISFFNVSSAYLNLGSKYGLENKYLRDQNPYEETFLESNEQQQFVEPESYYDIPYDVNNENQQHLTEDRYPSYYQPPYEPMTPQKAARLQQLLKELEENKEFVDVKANIPHHKESGETEQFINQEQDTSYAEGEEKSQKEVFEPTATKSDEKEKELPAKPVKKGQSEFVEYVEPAISKAQKNVQKLDFMGPSSDKSSSSIAGVFSNGNIFMGIVMSMLIVGVILGTLTGGYYYRNIYRNQDPDFSDFTHYSPAGPGRDKKSKKYMNGHSLETGDDTLAYKAQLQHYQQAKQKIIYGDDIVGEVIPGVDYDENNSDEEVDGDNNYSVYECPGLAPTGDIEITNPNFDINPQQ
uniref:Neural proliferation differentiation and control protein 1 n=1 Tax=Strongyloides venezuelensis TaxID=75913 RepID=A0A0K0FU60_STRVS